MRRDEFPQITFRDAAAYLDLPAERVQAAVRYYATYRDEVDEIAARETATAERAEQLWRDAQQILAS